MTSNKSSSTHQSLQQSPRRFFFYQKLVLAIIGSAIVGGLGFYSIWISVKREPAPIAQGPQLVALQSRRPLVNFAPAGLPASVHLWANYCSPCIKEIPSLMAWTDLWNDPSFKVLFINVDTDPEQVQAALEFSKGFPTERFSFVDGKKIFAEMSSPVLPRHLIIDRSGKIAVDYAGVVEGHEAEWLRLLRAVAREANP